MKLYRFYYLMSGCISICLLTSCDNIQIKKTPSTVLPTVTMQPKPFGNRLAAEFYVAQLNPADSNGSLVKRLNKNEVDYVVPEPLITAKHLVSTKITDSNTIGFKSVAIRLNNDGKIKIQTFLNEHFTIHPLYLIWKDEIFRTYSIAVLKDSNDIVIVDHLSEAEAIALKKAFLLQP